MAEDTCDLPCLDVPKAQAMREAWPDAEQLSATAGFQRIRRPTRLAIALALANGAGPA
jgi:hypothetical protein